MVAYENLEETLIATNFFFYGASYHEATDSTGNAKIHLTISAVLCNFLTKPSVISLKNNKTILFLLIGI